jgi:DNA adenine methylase
MYLCTTKMSYTKPVLKWVGGKTQIIEDVICVFPNEIHNYHEPFLGGGSVLLGILSCVKSGSIKITGKIYASDLNKYLIGLYKNIQSRLTELMTETQKIINEYQTITGTVVNRKPINIYEALTSQESYYFWIRSQFNSISNEERETPIASAMFLFLNKTCFRGIYREGPRGFNVPFGNYKNPSILNEAHIREVSELIQGVIFENQSFQHSLTSVKEGDFVYLDPPYAPEKDKSFVSYTSAGFSIEQHKELFDVCHTFRLRGVKMVMSNADVDLVKESFPSPIYTIKTISCRRAIHSKKPESRTNEVLIMNE